MSTSELSCLCLILCVISSNAQVARGPPGDGPGGNSCPSTVGRAPANLPKLGGNWANLMVDNRFECDGKVVAWEYYRGYAGSEAFVGVWRPTSSTKVYTLIGKTKLPRASIGKKLVDISDQPITVKEGDFIGIHYSRSISNAAISNALSYDLPNNELHDTVNAGIFDESMNNGQDVDFSRWPIVKRTYAIQAIMEPQQPDVTTTTEVPTSTGRPSTDGPETVSTEKPDGGSGITTTDGSDKPISLPVPVPVNTNCGVENGQVNDLQMSASSYTPHCPASNGRLHKLTPPIEGHLCHAWCAAPNVIDPKPWLQIDLGTNAARGGIVIQGRGDTDSRVEKFALKFSADARSWSVYSSDGNVKMFQHMANDGNEITKIRTVRIPYRYIRFYPTKWTPSNRPPCMRVEVLGCDDTAECKNTDANCEEYVKTGECFRNYAFMNKYCAKSCGFCSTHEEETVTKPTGPPVVGPTTVRPICLSLACPPSIRITEIPQPPGFDTPASDNIANDIAFPDCLDNADDCQGWAAQGECEINVEWMKTNCKRTCGYCGCIDELQSCKYWLLQDECNKNHAYMKMNCRKSCNTCSV
ncbi:uncharacterized protein LOC141899859 [Tubulanus polymorphus]|uniref:uncharacterized protein LOC141899859 n=1 Tax=Tubulanus polymorphus TaxID=672921 RepID=UPI003DA35E41